MPKRASEKPPPALPSDDVPVSGSDSVPAKVESAGNGACTTAIHKHKGNTYHPVLPIQLSQNGGEKLTAYCLYDSGSSGCSVSERLCEEMNLVAIETKLRLKTMHGSNVIDARAIVGLTVSDMKGSNDICLPRVFNC